MPVIIVALGIGLAGYGVWSVVRPTPVTVEIIKEVNERGGELVVDVAGQVISPGVYHLTQGARMGDALSRAGGLAVGADRGWIAANLNMAAILEDEQKIYIPKVGEQAENDGVEGEVKVGTRINLNKASQSELETLWGIGEARAGEIIAKRPYASLEEWQSKARIPQNVFDRVKGQVSVY